MKVIFSGLESSGKSLKLAMVAVEIAYRNAKWRDKSGIARPIVSNMHFSSAFEEHVVNDLGIPIIYWHNLSDLITMKDCDIFIDEVGTYFDSRLWAELSLDVRRWLTQGAKAGIEMYGAAQDFAQVDKAFRRLVWHLFLIKKVMGSRRPSATKPPVKRIWGICAMSELDPQGYDEDKKKFAKGGLIPKFFFIRRSLCEVFDTGQVLQRSKGDPLEHRERLCTTCGIIKTSHV